MFRRGKRESRLGGILGFDDVVSLSGTCKTFEFLRVEESIYKSVVQVSTDATAERNSPKRETGKSSRWDIGVRWRGESVAENQPL
jgi:hypothetical protein